MDCIRAADVVFVMVREIGGVEVLAGTLADFISDVHGILREGIFSADGENGLQADIYSVSHVWLYMRSKSHERLSNIERSRHSPGTTPSMLHVTS